MVRGLTRRKTFRLAGLPAVNIDIVVVSDQAGSLPIFFITYRRHRCTAALVLQRERLVAPVGGYQSPEGR